MQSDEALLDACAAGDSAAMTALLERFHDPVHRFMTRLLGGHRDDRDDAVQATFAEVARCARKFRRTSSVRVWIFGIAANIARNQIRSAVRRRRAESALSTLPSPPSATPDALTERRRDMARLAKAVDELSHPLRAAFVLCDVEELPCRDAARILKTSEGTIWRRVHEARRELRAALER